MILSALLSAVTGAFAGPRPAETRVHQPAVAQSVAIAVPAARIAAPATPRAHPVPPAPRAQLAAPPPAAPPASPPVGTDRLLE